MKRQTNSTYSFKVCLVVLLLITYFVGTSLATIAQASNSISDVSDIQAPQEFNPYVGVDCTKLGEYDSNYGNPNQIQFYSTGTNSYAIIDDQDGILILDVADPSNPVIANFFLEDEDISSIWVNDFYLYLSGIFNEIMIYDISNVYEPVQIYVGDSDDFDYFSKFKIHGNYLYGADGWDGLAIIDISNPLAPQFVGRYNEGPIGLPIYDLVIEENLVLATTIESIVIIDVTNKSNPILNNIYSHSDFAYFMQLWVQNDRLYLCSMEGQLYILDIANTSNLEILDYVWDSSKQFHDLWVDEDICFVLDLYTGVHVFNVSNPSMIDLLYIEPNYYDNYNHIALFQDHLYILNYLEGLEIYSLSDDYEPIFEGRFLDGGQARAVVKQGNFAFVANYLNGLEIFKLKKSVKPELKARILSGAGFKHLYLNKKLLYAITVNGYELVTIDISRPTKPEILSTQDLVFNDSGIIFMPMLIEIFDQTAFIHYHAGPINFLAILDLSDVNQFELMELIPFDDRIYAVAFDGYNLYVGGIDDNLYILTFDGEDYSFIQSYPIEENIYDLHLYRDYLFMATDNDLVIFDLINASSPNARSVFHGMASEFDGYWKIVVESDVAYLLGETYHEIQFVNVADVDEPELEATFRCNESISDLFVDNKFLYVSSDEVNLEVLKLNRFITSQARIIAPIAATVIIIVIPIVATVYYAKRKPEKKDEPKPQPEELAPLRFPDPEEIDIEVDPDDFEDYELYEYAQEIFEDHDDN